MSSEVRGHHEREEVRQITQSTKRPDTAGVTGAAHYPPLPDPALRASPRWDSSTEEETAGPGPGARLLSAATSHSTAHAEPTELRP